MERNDSLFLTVLNDYVALVFSLSKDKSAITVDF